jgi:hypothetical protein
MWEWSSVRDVTKNHTHSETNMIPGNKLTTAAATATEAWPQSLLLPNLHHLQNMAEWNNNEQNLEETTIHITTYHNIVTQTHVILQYVAVQEYCHKKTGYNVMTRVLHCLGTETGPCCPIPISGNVTCYLKLQLQWFWLWNISQC